MSVRDARFWVVLVVVVLFGVFVWPTPFEYRTESNLHIMGLPGPVGYHVVRVNRFTGQTVR